jgi:Protein of unknown function (DUF3300)
VGFVVRELPQKLLAYQGAQFPKRTAQAPRYMQWSAERLQQFVALIALYPDSLLSEILTASTFIEQGAETGRWVQSHPDLNSDALGQAVDRQPWPYSIGVFASFPSVLGNMYKNRSWTSPPGKSCNNQEHDVMDTAQVSGVSSDAFRGSDYAEQEKKIASKPQAKWQVGTVTAVQPYKVPNADPSITSYKVSVRVGNTVYVVLNTPRPGTDIGIYARGRQVPVLIGEHTITYNDRLGNSFQVPILSHTTVTPRDSR